VDTVFLALRVVVSLAAVFGGLWFAHRWLTKGRPGAVRAKSIGVIARQGLGAKAGIAIVDAGGRRYLLGVTEHQITVLDRLGTAEVDGTQRIAVLSTAPVPIPSSAGGGQDDGSTAGQQRRTDQGSSSPLTAFERELARAAGTAPVVVVPSTAGPAGPPTQTLTLPPAPQYQTRRAARDAENARTADPVKAAGPLAGSVLSPETWRQTAAALRRLR
jgi:flagellar protein FliO/FliZ